MSKKLVAYFSATGTTRKLAEKIAKIADADLFEIMPENPYTSADLNWNDSNSRSSLEIKDKNIRPKISNECKIENISKYDLIFVGFPIWWGFAPNIINSLLEEYDFSNKKIVLFATSGSSGIERVEENLKSSLKGAKVFAQKRFSASITEEEIKKWIKELEL